MDLRKKIILGLMLLCVFLVSFLGCEKADIIVSQDTQYSVEYIETMIQQETASPSETNSPMQSIEEKIFIMRGLEFPFDYTSKENSIKNNFVVISENNEVINWDIFMDFYNNYQNGIDSNVIIVKYINDTLSGQYAILFENGQAECEFIENNKSTFFKLVNIYNDNKIIFGTLDNGDSIVLIENSNEVTVSEPTPVNLSNKLNWAYNSENTVINWYIANTINKTNGEQKENLSKEQSTDILNLMLSEPVYYYNDVSDQIVNTALDVRVTIRNPENDMYVMLQTDKSIIIGMDGIRYVSFSESLYKKILNLIDMNIFDLTNIGNVKSISINYLDSKNNIQSIQINDTETIKNLVQNLKTSSIRMSRSGYKSSAQMVLHTENYDIVCSFYLKSMPEEPDGEIVINNFYWYNSQETLDLIRTLLN